MAAQVGLQTSQHLPAPFQGPATRRSARVHAAGSRLSRRSFRWQQGRGRGRYRPVGADGSRAVEGGGAWLAPGAWFRSNRCSKSSALLEEGRGLCMYGEARSSARRSRSQEAAHASSAQPLAGEAAALASAPPFRRQARELLRLTMACVAGFPFHGREPSIHTAAQSHRFCGHPRWRRAHGVAARVTQECRVEALV